MPPVFYIGLHHPSAARHFQRCCISVKQLRNRKKPLMSRILLDSGAFTELAQHGRYRTSVLQYADEIRRLHGPITLIEAAVTQDYMCEPFMLAKTGLSVEDHQRLTIERYDLLAAQRLPCPIMPVLQGFDPEDYARHISAYGNRLTPAMWTGVGSVCKRNSRPDQLLAVLNAIHASRPDLRLHGFGLKLTALADPRIAPLLHSADSMAWSFAARYEGRNANSWTEARTYLRKIKKSPPVTPTSGADIQGECLSQGTCR
jgi:hypothetical protein